MLYPGQIFINYHAQKVCYMLICIFSIRRLGKVSGSNFLLERGRNNRSSHPEVFLGKGANMQQNMQQMYGKAPMPKCDLQLCNFIEITLWHEYSPVNLQYIFRIPFPKNTSGWLLLK